MAERDDEDSLALLMIIASRDPDPRVRAEAVLALGERGDPTGVRALRYSVADDSTDVRLASIQSLIDIGHTNAAWALAAALSDEDVSLRLLAVDGLARIGGDVSASVLQRALADEDETVRESARAAIHDLSEAPPEDASGVTSSEGGRF